jgi:hypothetical protein
VYVQAEVEALAGVPADAPVPGSDLPPASALLKRCRQISTVLLRCMRKEKYMKVCVCALFGGCILLLKWWDSL